MAKNCVTVAMLNHKGGVGKTTLAFQLAVAFLREGKKVLCLDLDPQANFTSLLSVQQGPIENGIFTMLINSLREFKALHRPLVFDDVLQRSAEGLDFIASGEDLSGFELTVASMAGPRQLVLRNFLQKSGVLDSYDVILIDGPPTLGLLVINILCAVKFLCVPFTADLFSFSALAKIEETLENIADMGLVAVPKICGYIPNLIDGRRKEEGPLLEKIRQQLVEQGAEDQLYPPLYNRVQLVTSVRKKRSVFFYEGREYVQLRKYFTQLAKSILAMGD